nr:MAG TPA: hypothetical protein [Caudoviricetes sp.]
MRRIASSLLIDNCIIHPQRVTISLGVYGFSQATKI